MSSKKGLQEMLEGYEVFTDKLMEEGLRVSFNMLENNREAFEVLELPTTSVSRQWLVPMVSVDYSSGALGDLSNFDLMPVSPLSLQDGRTVRALLFPTRENLERLVYLNGIYGRELDVVWCVLREYVDGRINDKALDLQVVEDDFDPVSTLRVADGIWDISTLFVTPEAVDFYQGLVDVFDEQIISDELSGLDFSTDLEFDDLGQQDEFDLGSISFVDLEASDQLPEVFDDIDNLN